MTSAWRLLQAKPRKLRPLGRAIAGLFSCTSQSAEFQHTDLCLISQVLPSLSISLRRLELCLMTIAR